MTIDAVLLAAFALGAAVFVYHHFVYPVLLRQLAAFFRRSGRYQEVPPELFADAELPSVALIVPVYNEAATIRAKIADLAALDYPRDRLTIVVALDGCRDDSHRLAEEALAALPPAVQTVRVVNHAVNRGKIAVLNEHVTAATADIVALNDATTMLAPDTLRRAVAHFRDAGIGVVCGAYKLSEAGSEGERAYWNYQTRIKWDEATIATPMGVHGAFYMIRRRCWEPLPPDTINDDFVIPMRIVAKGFRAIYDRSILAMEAERTTSREEFRRRVRIGAGNMQQLLRYARLGSPRLGWVAFLFWSGKGMRPLVPFFVLLAFAATALLALRGWGLFNYLLAAELAAFAFAAAVIRWRFWPWPKPLAWLGYLVEGHAASFIGAVRELSGGMARW